MGRWVRVSSGSGGGGGGGGVVDHGELLGLGDNDHPQYVMASGEGYRPLDWSSTQSVQMPHGSFLDDVGVYVGPNGEVHVGLDGNVDMSDAASVAVPEPLADQHATTKAYVDGVAGAVDHAELTGLTDNNDHPQYAAIGDTLGVGGFTGQRKIDSASGRAFYWDGTFWVEIAGTPPEVSNLELSDLGGVVSPSQGGFGFDIDSVTGDPASALELLGGARQNHVRRVDWKVIDTTTYTLVPSDEGRVLLFAIPGNAACTVTLEADADQPGWASGMNIGLMAYSSGAITVTAPAGVRIDGVDGASVQLVQHAMSSLTRQPAGNFWNFSGQVGP
jgi:hypothetical protein